MKAVNKSLLILAIIQGFVHKSSSNHYLDFELFKNYFTVEKVKVISSDLKL